MKIAKDALLFPGIPPGVIFREYLTINCDIIKGNWEISPARMQKQFQKRESSRRQFNSFRIDIQQVEAVAIYRGDISQHFITIAFESMKSQTYETEPFPSKFHWIFQAKLEQYSIHFSPNQTESFLFKCLCHSEFIFPSPCLNWKRKYISSGSDRVSNANLQPFPKQFQSHFQFNK